MEKTQDKTGNLVGLLKPVKKGKKLISNKQVKKLFDIGELGRAESKKSRKTTEDDPVLLQSPFWLTRKEIQHQLTPTILSFRKTHQRVF